eukprot:361579-Chlamydomonas_euryale.AAC.3
MQSCFEQCSQHAILSWHWLWIVLAKTVLRVCLQHHPAAVSPSRRCNTIPPLCHHPAAATPSHCCVTVPPLCHHPAAAARLLHTPYMPHICRMPCSLLALKKRWLRGRLLHPRRAQALCATTALTRARPRSCAASWACPRTTPPRTARPRLALGQARLCLTTCSATATSRASWAARTRMCTTATTRRTPP